MSTPLVPIEIVRAAQSIPFSFRDDGNTHLSAAANLHRFRFPTPSSETTLVSGFYKVADREGRTSTYTYAESKIVLLGEIDILDHATGIKHTVIPGDFVYLPIGSSVDFSSASFGLAFYVVTREMLHPYQTTKVAKM